MYLRRRKREPNFHWTVDGIKRLMDVLLLQHKRKHMVLVANVYRCSRSQMTPFLRCFISFTMRRVIIVTAATFVITKLQITSSGTLANSSGYSYIHPTLFTRFSKENNKSKRFFNVSTKTINFSILF